jgi:7,8-dihydropterin-6-yl-methyl-4-(beta-D-ribofuranosyl)aminobenzene 5'-phosphate synthase
MEITTLVENSQGEHTGLVVEHGLSFLIESETTSILFDTGQSDAFIRNAQKLQKDLSRVEHVVLSHGHYDHSGGFRSFVGHAGAGSFKLWTGEGFFTPKYGKFNSSYQYLGNDFDVAFVADSAIEHRTVTGVKEIARGVHLVTDFARIHRDETIHPRFVLKEEGEWRADSFDDELLLVVESAKGLVVVVGCSHPGILNMLDTVIAHFKRPIYALVGGTHLVEADHERAERTIAAFSERGIEVLGISHCSGVSAIEMSVAHSDHHYYNHTGSSLPL